MKFSYKHSMDIAKIPYHSYAKRKVYLDIQGTMDYISKKDQVQRLPDKIAYIGQVEDILAWKIDTDYSQGGNSMASLEVIEDYCNFEFSCFQRLSSAPKRT